LFSAALKDDWIAMVKICDRIHNVSTIQALGFERAVNILDETDHVLLPFFRSMNLPMTDDLARLCVRQRVRLATTEGSELWFKQKGGLE